MKNHIITDFLIRVFWNGLWSKWMTIALLTLIAQLLLRYFDNNWEIEKMWYVIIWASWFVICLIVRIVRRKNVPYDTKYF